MAATYRGLSIATDRRRYKRGLIVLKSPRIVLTSGSGMDGWMSVVVGKANALTGYKGLIYNSGFPAHYKKEIP